MTRPELNTSIDTNVTNRTAEAPSSAPLIGTEMKKVADYVDQEIGFTSGTIEMELGVEKLLLYSFNQIISDANNRNTVLPESPAIGKKIQVNNDSFYTVRVYANAAHESKMIIGDNNANATNKTLRPLSSYIFTHIGEGFWRADVINGNELQMNGTVVGNSNNIQTLAVNSSPTPYLIADLTAAYPSAQNDFKVVFDNVTPMLLYTKVTSAFWIKQEVEGVF